VRDLSLWVC